MRLSECGICKQLGLFIQNGITEMENVIQMNNKRLVFLMLAAAGLLMVPLVAMRFTSEVNWSVFDFIVAGVLLFGTGLAIELALRIVTGFWTRSPRCSVCSLFSSWSGGARGRHFRNAARGKLA